MKSLAMRMTCVEVFPKPAGENLEAQLTALLLVQLVWCASNLSLSAPYLRFLALQLAFHWKSFPKIVAATPAYLSHLFIVLI